MIDDRIRAALKNDIAARLLEGGVPRWKEIQSRYPQVSSATFFRLVGQIKAQQASVDEGQSAETGMIHREIVADNSRPPPNWATRGVGLQVALPADRLISEIASQFDDADLLRAYALDARGTIKLPAAFADSMKQRDRAIRAAVHMLAEIHRMSALADFQDALVETVAANDPDTAKRLMLALYELQTRNLTPAPKIQRGISGDIENRLEPVP